MLGANDGIVSTASLMIGVAAAQAERGDVALAGVAGLVAGAMSMAAGEFVSVSSQADGEKADLAKEARELRDSPVVEMRELVEIYIERGLEPDLAREVAKQLTAHDPLGAHARDELGITPDQRARPLLAAMASAIAFSIGAGVPLAVLGLVEFEGVEQSVALVSIASLAILGAWAAHTGGAPKWVGAVRVTFWGALAMAATAAVGSLFRV